MRVLPAHPPGHSGVRWHILALLTLASFTAYILRTNLSIAGERMMPELGLSQLQLGYILAAFAWGYAIFQFPGGVFGDRLGGRKALALIAVGWGVCNLLVGLTPSASVLSPTLLLAGLMALRFLMGVVQAPLYPVTSGGTTSAWFPLDGWALPNGLTNFGLTLGSAATGPLIVWLMGWAGWRGSFLLTAPLAFLMAALWWWYARDTPAEHPAVHREELALIDRNRPPPVSAAVTGDWRRAMANRQVLLLTASYFCSNYVFYFFFNWLFIYLIDERHFKSLEGGFYAAAPWMIGAVGAVIGGLAADRLTRRRGIRLGTRIPAVAGLLLSALFLWLASRADSPVLAVVFLSLCLGGQQMSEGPFWAATIAASGQQASAACGILNTGGNVVGGVGALLVPIVVARVGWPAALASAALFAVVAGLLWLWVDPDPHAGTTVGVA